MKLFKKYSVCVSLVLLIAMLLAGCGQSVESNQPEEPSKTALYTAGTYEVSAPGNNGDIAVSVTFTDDKIEKVEITNMLPFAVLPMYSSIEKLSKSLLEASADLGASRSTTFFNITLPLTFPGIFSSIILVFIPSLGIYTVTDMLGGGKVLYIGNIIKNQFGAIRNWPLGAALSVLLIVITGLLIFIYTRFAKIEDMEVV
jgi:spermidine/putrescine transport system permease protein